jgi:hypothetical protein
VPSAGLSSVCEMAPPPLSAAPAAPAAHADADPDPERRGGSRRGPRAPLCTAQPGSVERGGHGHARTRHDSWSCDGDADEAPSCDRPRQELVHRRVVGAPVSSLPPCRVRYGAPVRVRTVQPICAGRRPCHDEPGGARTSRACTVPACRLRALRTTHAPSPSCRLVRCVVDAVRECIAGPASHRS